MSLAYAIQRAAPYYQAKALGDAVLSGSDPFAAIPGFEVAGGNNDTPATGGLPPLQEMLKSLTGKDSAPTPQSIDPGFSINSALPSAIAQLAASPNPSITSQSANPLGTAIFDPGPYKPDTTFSGPFGAAFNDLSKAKYNQLNFPHYAAPEGSNLPFVGSNYKGDQGGYWYDPYTNQYRPNENSLIDTMDKQGAVTNAAKISQKFGITPQTPGVGSELLNTLLGASGTGLGSYLGKNLFGGDNLASQIFGSLIGGNAGGSSDPATQAALAAASGLGIDPSALLGAGNSSGSSGLGGLIGTIGGLASIFG